jgi:hypothetical protein
LEGKISWGRGNTWANSTGDTSIHGMSLKRKTKRWREAKMPQIGMSLNETLKKAGCSLLSGTNPSKRFA